MKLDRRSILYRVLENGMRLGGIVLFSLVTSASTGSAPAVLGTLVVLVVVGVGLSVGWELARYRRYDYALTADTVDIRSGVLSRREREIPYDRIQNVDVAQNVLQRAIGIAAVRLETAGGNATEAHLRYVSATEATRLQESISRRKGGATPDGTDAVDERLFALSDREHLVLGIVSADLRLLGVLSVIVPVVAPSLARGLGPQYDLLSLFGPAIALASIAGLWILSGLLQILRYYRFSLSRHGSELRYERGLLQRYTGTIPLSKVQALTVQETVLARTLGYASLVIQTAGSGPGGGGSRTESAVPIAERDRALALAREVEPVGDLDLQRPPRRARTRYAVRYATIVVGLTAVLGVVDAVTGAFGPWYLPLVGLLAVPVGAHLTWANRGYQFDDDYVVTRNGFWRRRTMIVPYDRVQTVISSQSIFQRRRGLGTVTVDTAGGGGRAGGDAVAVDVDAALADRLRETVADRLQLALRVRS